MARKQQNIKRIAKKSIIPSVLLFIVFIGICEGLFLTFVITFKDYIIGCQITEFYEEAEHIGQIISSKIKEGEIWQAESFAEEYLREDSALCVTDEKNRIVKKSKDAEPDFSEPKEIDLTENYIIFPDLRIEKQNDGKEFTMSYQELFWRSLFVMTKKDSEEDWMERKIIDSHFWIEIPIQAENYHFYYGDSITVKVKNTYYMIVAILVGFSLVTVLHVILFINVLSSIITQRRMVTLYYQDTITGGKNWLSFIQNSQKILCRIRNASSNYVLVNLHMDRYQDYCACYGSKDGEALLKNIYAFLSVNIRRQETFARFAIADYGLLLRCDSMNLCEKRIKKLLAELTGIRRDRALSFHVGLYEVEPITNGKIMRKRSKKQIDVNQIYSYANAARESIPEKDTNIFIKVFDEQILHEQLWKRKIEDMMESALLNKEFQIYLQPKYNPLTRKIVSAEALVRWMSPSEGMILPERFISIFEENGFVTRLDDYMVLAVAKLQSERKLQGKKNIPVSVNISSAHFTKEDLAQHICQLVDSYGADHALIELELTESAFFGNKSMLQKILKELKNYGFRISMDDFGSGYSSLNLLKDLRLDVLKLDIDFFQGEDSENRGKIVVTEAIRLAKNLNLEIVAEGIEKREQVEFLAKQGCDMIQGYYFAKPMPVSAFDLQMELDG